MISTAITLVIWKMQVFCGWIVVDEGEKEFQVWGAVLQRMELRR